MTPGQKPIDSKDLLYLAGFLDGEGCFAYYGSPTVKCSNTYKPILDRLASAFGGSVTTSRSKDARHRTIHQWQAYGKTALEAIRLLLPHLVEKHAQAALVLVAREAEGMARDVVKHQIRVLKHLNYEGVE